MILGRRFDGWEEIEGVESHDRREREKGARVGEEKKAIVTKSDWLSD